MLKKLSDISSKQSSKYFPSWKKKIILLSDLLSKHETRIWLVNFIGFVYSTCCSLFSFRTWQHFFLSLVSPSRYFFEAKDSGFIEKCSWMFDFLLFVNLSLLIKHNGNPLSHLQWKQNWFVEYAFEILSSHFTFYFFFDSMIYWSQQNIYRNVSKCY